MRVDVIEVAGGNARALQRGLHAAERAIAILAGRGDVVGIARHAVANDFGIDLRPARLRMLKFFQHDNAGALAHHEAIAILIIRARGLFGRVVEPVESARQAAKPASEMREIGDSAPPATITSASPNAIIRAPSPMAWAPVEQAVTPNGLAP